MVDARQQVLHFLVSPVREDRRLPRLSASGTAAIVHCQHEVAGGGEKLTLERRQPDAGVEQMLVLAIGAAVNAQNQRIPSTLNEVGRLYQQCVDREAVAISERDILGRPELDAREQAVVDVCQRALNAVLQRVHFSTVTGRAVTRDGAARRRDVERRYDSPSTEQSRDRAISHVHSSKVNGTIIAKQKADAFAIGRPRK